MTSVQYLIHRGGVCLLCVFAHLEDLKAELTLAKGYFNDVAFLYRVGRTGGTAVDTYVLGVTRLVCNRAALDNARHLKKFVKSHQILRKNRKPGTM